MEVLRLRFRKDVKVVEDLVEAVEVDVAQAPEVKVVEVGDVELLHLLNQLYLVKMMEKLIRLLMKKTAVKMKKNLI